MATLTRSAAQYIETLKLTGVSTSTAASSRTWWAIRSWT